MLQVVNDSQLPAIAWKPIWWTGTNNMSAVSINMQHDGNLVVYDVDGNPLWPRILGQGPPRSSECKMTGIS